MKVLREATNDIIKTAKENFEKSNNDAEKLDILGDFLTKTSPKLDENVWMRLKNFNINFLSRWMEAFKWEEAGNDDNEFIRLLNRGAEINNFVIVDSEENFNTAYNCYAGKDYFDNEEVLHYNPIYVESTYTNSIDDVKEIVGLWSEYIKKLRASGDNSLKSAIEKFYEKTNFKEQSMSNWTLKSLTQIKRSLKDDNIKISNNDQDELIRLLKNKNNRDFAKKYLDNENNNQQ